jgi:hypothetical protein
VIVGTALYEGRFRIADAKRVLSEERTWGLTPRGTRAPTVLKGGG